MLTARQLMMTTTRRRQSPFHLHELRDVFKTSPTAPISIRTIINGIREQKFFFFVEIRDQSLLRSAKSLSELQKIFRSSRPTLITLKDLSKMLGSVGGSIRFLSANRQVAGISGQIEVLAKIPTVRLTPQNYDAARDLATGFI